MGFLRKELEVLRPIIQILEKQTLRYIPISYYLILVPFLIFLQTPGSLCYVYLDPKKKCNYTDYTSCVVYLGRQILHEVDPRKEFYTPNWETFDMASRKAEFTTFISTTSILGVLTFQP